MKFVIQTDSVIKKFLGKGQQNIVGLIFGRFLVFDILLTVPFPKNFLHHQKLSLKIEIHFRVNWYIKYPTSVLRPDFFMQPFHKDLWMAIFVFILVGNTFLVALSKLKLKKAASAIDNTFLIFERLCNQSSNGKMKNYYLKLVCILSQMIALTITASFGAVITSYVAVETLQVPFTNIEEFVENGRYKFATKPESFVDQYFCRVKLLKKAI